MGQKGEAMKKLIALFMPFVLMIPPIAVSAEVPTIEGIAPADAWGALKVFLALCVVVVVIDKALDVWRKYKARKAINAGPEGKLAENISKRIIAELEPRFQSIESKLSNDNRRIDAHSQQLETMEANYADSAEARKIILAGVKAILSHEINGNSTDKLKSALAEIDDYLINR